MNNSLQKAKYGQRKAKPRDTRDPARPVREPRKPQAEAVKRQRKLHAQTVIESALIKDDSIIQSHKDIVKVLRDYARTFALPPDHFDILDNSDHCDLYIRSIKSQITLASLPPPVTQPSPHTKIQHGQTTPVLGPVEVESGARVAQERDEDTDEEHLEVTPLEGDQGDMFNVNIYPTSRAGPEIVRGCYCQNARSYISIKIITRHRLKFDPDRTIRLTWEESDISSQGPKMKSTRFWIVANDKVHNDLAIGTEWDQADDSDDEYGCLGVKHRGEMDEITEGEYEDDDDDDNDSLQYEEEDTGGAEEGDEDEGFSGERGIDDEESECEPAADEEQVSSDDSYVRVSDDNEMIVSPDRNPIRHLDYGSQVAGKVLLGLMNAANDSQQAESYTSPKPTNAGRSQPTRASSKQSSSLSKIRGTDQRTHASRSKQPAPEPERKTRTKHGTAKGTRIPPKRRDSGTVSYISDDDTSYNPPSHRKTKRK